MTDDPYVSQAQARLSALIDEAEIEMIEGPPLTRYYVGERWGVEPWVVAAMEADSHLTTLQDLAVAFEPDPDTAREACMGLVTRSLRALALYEEMAQGNPGLDDQELAAFLEKLQDSLDVRLGRLKEHQGHVHVSLNPDATFEKDGYEVATPEAVAEYNQARAEGRNPTVPHEPDDELTPGLAFTSDYPGMVGGEVAVQDPPARRPGRLINVEEVPEDQATSHDFRDEDMPPPVDLEVAYRELGREMAKLKVTANPPQPADLPGRHMSPEDTQPDMGEVGRRTKE